MPANTTLVDRFNEIAAIAACRSSLDRLDEMAREPSGKRFARSRHDACLYWEQVEVTAATRKQAIQQAPSKRAVKPRKLPVAAGNNEAGTAAA